MGVHHILSTIIGDVLANLFDFGNEVIRINHLGDWDELCEVMVGMEKWGDQEIKSIPTMSSPDFMLNFMSRPRLIPHLLKKHVKFSNRWKKECRPIGALEMDCARKLGGLEKIFVRLGVEFDHITVKVFILMADEVLADGIQKLCGGRWC